MKAKLVKKGEEYILNPSIVGYKLSKQNCDEIFGVVDVEKLAEEFYDSERHEQVSELLNLGFIDGFNKAMELNKDKVFTLEDIKRAIDKAKQGSVKETHNGYGRPTEPRFVLDDLSYDEIIQSLQQPNEIEVEIEMFRGNDVKSVARDWDQIGEPKLDSQGCLILKKI